MQTTHNSKASHQWRRILLLVLLLAASAEFFLRGPLRLLHGTEWNDFLSPYIQSRAWIHGMDPYATQNLVKLWPVHKPMFTFVARDAAEGTLAFKRGVPAPYPISSFVILAPIALLPWGTSQFLWTILNHCSIAFIIWGLVTLFEASWHDPRTSVFVGFGIAFAPLHTGLVTENPIIIALGLGVGALLALKHSRHYMGAIALAIAICLKPQVGLCFLLFFLIQRRWRTVTAACVISILVLLVAVTRLTVAGTPWLGSYLDISRSMFSPGAINDFTPANPIWFHMLNLQIVLFPLFGSALAANLCALLVAAVLGSVWLLIVIKKGRDFDHALAFSVPAVVSLLPVYHRFYDSALLIFPIAWALMGEQRQSRAARASLVACALFLTPGGVLISQLADRIHLSAPVANSWWWRSLIIGHQVWAILFLAIFLLSAMRKPAFESAPEHRPSEAVGLVPQAL